MSIRMKSILERFLAYFFIAVLVLFNIRLVFVLKNKVNSNNEIIVQINTATEEIEKINSDNEKLDIKISEKQKQQEDINKKSELFVNYFISRGEIPKIMAGIQKIGDESSVRIKLFEYVPLKDEKLTGFTKLDFMIGFSGKYHQIKRFLWKLEKLPWVLKQSEINFLKLYDSKNLNDEMELTIKLFTFIREENVKTASAH
ncbi:MAG: type 4a pilus biogenesis protein PilO [Candidatus Muiribacteriota bacterium]